MSEKELAAWLALVFTPKIGSKAMARLIAIDTPLNLRSRNNDELRAIGFSPSQVSFFKQGSDRQVEGCLNWQQASSHHILTPLHRDYSPLLNEVSLPPPALFIKGM